MYNIEIIKANNKLMKELNYTQRMNFTKGIEILDETETVIHTAKTIEDMYSFLSREKYDLQQTANKPLI